MILILRKLSLLNCFLKKKIIQKFLISCFLQGKCQRKDPPCKYLHPPQHLREQLLQNGRNNLILKNLQMQAAAAQSLLPSAGIVPGMLPTIVSLINSVTIKSCVVIYLKKNHLHCKRITVHVGLHVYNQHCCKLKWFAGNNMLFIVWLEAHYTLHILKIVCICCL